MPISPLSSNTFLPPSVDDVPAPTAPHGSMSALMQAIGWAPPIDSPVTNPTGGGDRLPPWPSGIDFDTPQVNLDQAIGILNRHYATIAGASQLDGDHDISTIDLDVVARDTSLPDDVREAAAYLLQGNAARNALDTAAGKGNVDGMISRNDLKAAPGVLEGANSVRLLDTAAGHGGQDGYVSDNDMSAALRDPSLPPALRNSTAFSLLGDAELARIIGKPDIDPSLSPADHAKVLRAFANLIRSSPLGAIEAKRLVDYGTTLTLSAHGASTTAPDGSRITLSNDMIQGIDGGAGVLAHEGGHVIFAKSGLNDKIGAQERNGTLPPHTGNLLNEAFAGAFGNRVHLAWSAQLLAGAGGSGEDLEALSHLSLLSDVMHNLTPGSYYANYYGVDVGKALQHLDGIKHVIANDLAPYLRQNFPISDTFLTSGL